MPYKDSARRKANQARYEALHKEKRRGVGKAWREANKQTVKERNLLHKYGLLVGDIEFALKKQNNCCAICKRSDPGPKGWCIDHDHETGLFRGILCTRCNQSLGMNGDSLKALENTYNNQKIYLLRAEEHYSAMLQAAEIEDTNSNNPG